MQAIFWRLLAAHLFVDFPLRNHGQLYNINEGKKFFLHIVFVILLNLAVFGEAAFYRPVLFLMIFLVVFAHAVLDIVLLRKPKDNARSEGMSFFLFQFIMIAFLIVLAWIFSRGRRYGYTLPFLQFSLAIIAIWVAPTIVHIVKKMKANAPEIGLFEEPFGKLAVLERALLFVAISFGKTTFLIAGVVIAVIIRGLLILNEENVPKPIVEWAVAIAAGLLSRYLIFGKIF